jgi:hypothetical protein
MTHDAANADQQLGRLWLLFLAGPVIYAAYFLSVFTLGEFGCLAGIQRLRWLGLDPIRLGVVVLTVIAAAATIGIGAIAYHRWHRLHYGPEDPDEDDPKFMLFVGTWLSGIFTVVTVATAVPMLLGSACDWI